jgi:hypothetical protein
MHFTVPASSAPTEMHQTETHINVTLSSCMPPPVNKSEYDETWFFATDGITTCLRAASVSCQHSARRGLAGRVGSVPRLARIIFLAMMVSFTSAQLPLCSSSSCGTCPAQVTIPARQTLTKRPIGTTPALLVQMLQVEGKCTSAKDGPLAQPSRTATCGSTAPVGGGPGRMLEVPAVVANMPVPTLANTEPL